MQNRQKWITAAVLTGATCQAWGTGFRLPDQDAFATARGEAFVATANNPSAIYYNPAGITQLEGSQFRGGVYGIYLNPTYTNPNGDSFSNEKDLHAIPQLFYTYTPKDLPLSFGIGAYAPFGLSSSWPDDTGFRTVATEGSLTYYTVNPVIAWKVTDRFSIAAGVRLNYAEVKLQQGLVWPAQNFDEFRFKGEGWDVGYNVGLLWKVTDKVSLGASFRSSTTVNVQGHTDVHNDVAFPPGNPILPPFRYQSEASGELPFPLSVAVGISYRPTPEWNFEFNADYNGWDRLNTVTIKQDNAPVPLIPQSVPVVLNWESSWYYEFGATRYLGNGWSISGGYIFNENALSSASYTPLVADQDRHFFSVGTGYSAKKFSVDVAYQFGWGPSRTISDGTPSLTGQSANGQYEFISHAISVSGGWKF